MTAEEKKLTVKRILIFILLAYIPNYALEIGLSDHKGGLTSAAAGITLMLYPAIANILTRIITKEGKEEHYLKADLKKHKGIYTAAALAPLAAGFINLMIFHFLLDGSTDMGSELMKKTDGMGIKLFIPLVLMSYMESIPLMIMGFGEEFGWRAYLTPKLEKLMPRFPACCITGVVWALWHAPLIWYGYDFGKGYPGFPYAGILAMCLCCIPLSYVLTVMTEKTKSVFPAAICHMLIDKVMNLPAIAMTDSKVLEKNSFAAGVIMLGAVPFAAAVCIFAVTQIRRKVSQQ